MSERTTRSRARDPGKSPWAAGASVFAASMMILVGVFQVIEGLVALVDGNDFLVATPDYVFRFSATTWGWIHLLVGLVLLAAGVFIFTGNALARGVGILLAAVSAVVNFLWIPYYPIWALAVVALNVFVIWGLARSDLNER